MIGYETLKKKLVSLDAARLNPVSVDFFDKCMSESSSLEEAHEKYISNGGVYEEFSYGVSAPTLYPVPNSYDNSTIDKEQIGFVGNIDAAIRQQALNLKSIKKPDQSVVYSDLKKEAIIIDKVDLDDFVKRGYIVVYEEANVAPAPTGGQFTNTDGAFNKVAGVDKILFGKNKKELKKYKGKVFEIPSAMFKKMKEGRERYSRWSDYIEEDGDTDLITTIKNYSFKNSTSPVIIQDEETGERAILRRRTDDFRLKHNRSK
jgi:hypothetical protein